MSESKKLDMLCSILILDPLNDESLKNAEQKLDECQNDGGIDGTVTEKQWTLSRELINTARAYAYARRCYSGDDE
jgi:hypothetical protein